MVIPRKIGPECYPDLSTKVFRDYVKLGLGRVLFDSEKELQALSDNP
jgi:hypothetical protein